MQRAVCLLLVVGRGALLADRLCHYVFSAERKDWEGARAFCEANHAGLATVAGMADVERLRASGEGFGSGWIGLTKANKSRWHWALPGLEFDESRANWTSGGARDDAAASRCGYVSRDLSWRRLPCDTEAPFVCYHENGSKRFHLIGGTRTWRQAQDHCRTRFTDLVSGHEQLGDEDFSGEIANERGPMAIGLFRDAWEWSDGSDFSFRYWHDDDDDDDDDDCVEVRREEGMRWKLDSCTKKKHFVCCDDKLILIKQNLTWQGALSYCREQHGDLVSITGADDQRRVQEKVAGAHTAHVWVGMRYTCALDLWFWISDQLVCYENWDSVGPVDECDMAGAVSAGAGCRWSSQRQDKRFNFVCSKH